jgi:hypothetical protein
VTTNTHLPALSEPKSSRKRTVSRRVRHACDLLITGECKTITAAAKRAGLSREHLSRTLRSPHGQVFWTQRAVETIRAAAPIAAQRLVSLLHGASEHVAFDAAKHVLGIEGIAPAERPSVQVNLNQNVGFVVDWRNSRLTDPTNPQYQAPSDTQSPPAELLTIEHQAKSEDEPDGR